MSNLFEINAEPRQQFGKGASRRLRRLGDRVPAIMYGGGEAALPLSFDHNELQKSLKNEAFYSHILTLNIEGKPQKAVLKAIQRHPYKARILHLDLLRITGKEKIHMHVPLHFSGEDVAPGVKEGNGVVSHLISSVEIRCLPANLPEYIKVDISKLALDEAIHLSHLKLPEGVELVELLHGNDQAVVSIHIPRIIEEEVVVAEVPAAEVPATAQTATTAEKPGTAAPAKGAPAASAEDKKKK